LVADFLPAPADLAFHEEGVKVTLALSKTRVDFFKSEAQTHQTQYPRMIPRLPDSYVGRSEAPRHLLQSIQLKAARRFDAWGQVAGWCYRYCSFCTPASLANARSKVPNGR
jgi:hypothetical protein